MCHVTRKQVSVALKRSRMQMTDRPVGWTTTAARGWAVAVASVTSGPARAQMSSDGDGYGHHMMWDLGYGMVFGSLFMILVLAAVIAVVVLMVRWFGGPGGGYTTPSHPPPARTPLDLLKERYARGEIDQKEFEERRRVLGD